MIKEDIIFSLSVVFKIGIFISIHIDITYKESLIMNTQETMNFFKKERRKWKDDG